MAPPINSSFEAAIGEYDEWLKTKLQSADEADRVTSPLYHYTNAEGLMGMIKNQEVWLTDIFHLSDPSELNYGVRLALDELWVHAKKGHRLLQWIHKHLSKVLTGEVQERIGFFVASFSRHENDLGQWRAYGDNGKGFSLGVAASLFNPALIDNPKPNAAFIVARVTYDEVKAKQLQSEAVGRAVSILNKFVDGEPIRDPDIGGPFVNKLMVLLSEAILYNSLTIKHPAYVNEQETRLILLYDATKLGAYLKTRNRGGEIVPYIPITLALQAAGNITQIMTGPSAVPQAHSAVQKLLTSLGITADSLITSSGIPYRA